MSAVFKYVFLTLISFVIYFNCFAQDSFIIKGIIFNQSNTSRIDNAVITNSNTLTKTKSDEFGTFSLEVKIGDTIKIYKENFQEVFISIAKKQNLVVYLKATYQLNEVLVSSQTTKQLQQEILDGYRAKGVYNNGKVPLLMYIFNPLSALQNLIGDDAKNARAFTKYIEKENKENFIDSKFNKALIIKNVSIKNEDVAVYMYKFRPKYEDVIYWNEYDAINYIKKSYQQFLKSNR